MKKTVIYIIALAMLLSTLLGGCLDSGQADIGDMGKSSDTETGDDLTGANQGETSHQSREDASTETGVTDSHTLPEEVQRVPLSEGAILPVLTGEDFQKFNTLTVPNLSAQKLKINSYEDAERLMECAKQAAVTRWGTYTVNEYGWLVSPVEDDGYYEYIAVSGDGIGFFGKYGDTEADGFPCDNDVTAEEAVASAKSVTDVFGLQDMTSADPDISTDRGGTEYIIKWPMMVDGLPIKGALTVTVIGGKVESMSFLAWEPEAVSEGAPQYILTPDQALYCMNYARSQVRRGDDPETESMFIRAQNPQSVSLEWYRVSYDTLEPAYLFSFMGNEYSVDGGLDCDHCTAIVNAYTGDIVLDVGYGEEWESPYMLQ